MSTGLIRLGAPCAHGTTKVASTCRSCVIIFVDFRNRSWRALPARCHCGSIHVYVQAYNFPVFVRIGLWAPRAGGSTRLRVRRVRRQMRRTVAGLYALSQTGGVQYLQVRGSTVRLRSAVIPERVSSVSVCRRVAMRARRQGSGSGWSGSGRDRGQSGPGAGEPRAQAPGRRCVRGRRCAGACAARAARWPAVASEMAGRAAQWWAMAPRGAWWPGGDGRQGVGRRAEQARTRGPCGRGAAVQRGGAGAVPPCRGAVPPGRGRESHAAGVNRAARPHVTGRFRALLQWVSSGIGLVITRSERRLRSKNRPFCK